MVTCPGAVTLKGWALPSQQLLFRLLLGLARQSLLGLLYKLWDLFLRWRSSVRDTRLCGNRADR
jgi:hypothetical protein